MYDRALDPRVQTRPDVTVLAASRVVMEEGRLPSRIVLYEDTSRKMWVVHTERLTLTEGGFVHWGFDHGDYCRLREAAERKFLERAERL